MRTTILHILIISLLAFSSVQLFAVEYKTTYRSSYSQPIYNSTTITTPVVGFHSTSVYTGQLVQEESMLNMDGSVNEKHYVAGPRRVIGDPDDDEPEEGEGGGENGSGQGGDNNWNGSELPLGDALLPLLLLAMVYIAYRCCRRTARP